MKITRIILADNSEYTQVVVDDSYVLDGVKSVNIVQLAGELPELVLQIEMKDVDIERM